MFEIDPRVRITPDKNCKEECTDTGGNEHDEETKKTLITGCDQSVIVESEKIC